MTLIAPSPASLEQAWPVREPINWLDLDLDLSVELEFWSTVLSSPPIPTPDYLLPPGAPEDLSLQQLVYARKKFSEQTRDSLSAVIAGEPEKVPENKMGPLLPYQQRTWPAYLLECRRFAVAHETAWQRKAHATTLLAMAELALAQSRGDTERETALKKLLAADQVHPRAHYVQHAALGGLKHWLQARVA